MTEAEITALRLAAESPVSATQADCEAVARDLSASFSQDPLFNWFLRDDAKRDPARLAMFRMLLTRIALPDGDVQRPTTGGAAAIWLSSDDMGPSPFWQELMALPTIIAATGFGRLSRMSAMRAAMDANHPMDRPHAYLWFLGVSPEAQGMGVGSRLLAAGLRKVDALGLPAFLESSNSANVPLYRRHGFEVVKEYQPAPGAPSIWAMWREPVGA